MLDSFKIKALYKKYEDYWPALFFLSGFLFDIVTLGRIDDITNIISQFFYLVLITAILILDFKGQNWQSFKHNWLNKIFYYKDEIFHFFLGALLSAFTLFYFKSASMSNSFLFMFMMALFLIINEFEAFQKLGLTIKSALIKLCLISYFLYLVPVILGTAGTLVFFLAVILSTLLLYAIFLYLCRDSNVEAERLKRELLRPGIIVLAVFIILYFLKVLPPVPLAVNKIGIYHRILKDYPRYELYRETPGWKFWRGSDTYFKARPDDKVYVFVKIFGPRGFKDKVFLHFQNYQDGWRTSDRIPIPISGGRGKGFRGYAYKQNYTPGEWRVIVETENGLEIGRLDFDIVKDDSKEKREFHRLIDQ